MKKKYELAALLSGALILSLTSCGDSEALRAELAGKWVRMVLAEGGASEGTLTFTTGGAFELSLQGGVKGYGKSSGKYRLSGRDIKFEDNSCNGNGSYRFLLKNGTLSFLPLNDACIKRTGVLTGEWRRKQARQ
jgi:hypothetical protein